MSSMELSLAQKAPALSIKNLSKTVELEGRELRILERINLEIKQGESLAIVGRSGSGKTTLLGLMAGLDEASEGELSLMDHRLDTMDEDERAALRAEYVGFVFQSFHLLPGMTALENVMLPMELLKKDKAQQKAAELLNSLGLEGRLHQYPAQLSGGEQQRVALARAVVCEPRVLFADEPTGNLDSQTGRDIIERLFAFNRELGTTLVLVTHDQDLAKQCDRQVQIADGCIVAEDSVGEEAKDIAADASDASHA